jgi:uncharacterized glyoxalase superfamily protein PhnB
MRLGAVVIDSDISDVLADFYARLLGWEKDGGMVDGENWIIVKSADGKGTPLVFQQDDDYVKPEWPTETGAQQQMMHLDFYVSKDEYQREIERAVSCGARAAETQFSDKWTVLTDPAGHPFCIIPIGK